jgi:type IV pilus assembly protein PilB
MKDSLKIRLGDLLVEYDKITKEQLNFVLNKQKVSGKRLGEILIDEGILTEEDILTVLEIQLNIKRINFDFTKVENEAVRAISENLAKKHNMIPVAIKKDKIHVVMSDPLNIFAMDDVKIATGLDAEIFIASNAEIKKAITKYYSSQIVRKAADDLSKEQVSQIQKSGIQDSESDEGGINDIKNAPVVRLVDNIIENAVRSRASDIHIEPFDTYVKIRYRVDGELIEMLRTPKDTQGALITRIKILANLNIAEKRVPQDGRIMTTVDGNAVDFRVSVLPTVNGEKIVIRILSRSNFMVGKKELGMSADDMDKLEKIISQPNGIILVTGPTGSGKSTTLYTILSELNKENVNVISVEDPVEFMLDGVNQVNVNTKAGLTFAAGLKSILRQDPDVVMVGEIRDAETAEIAVRAAITGHLVLSTLHTNDAPSSIIRLIDMGIEPYLITTSIVGVIAQRLVRRICPECGEAYEASQYEKKILEIPNDNSIILKKAKGCNYCNNSGYKGRIGIYEVMDFTREHREAVLNGCSTDELKDLSIKNKMKTIRSACAEHVLNGSTTIDELMRVAFLRD